MFWLSNAVVIFELIQLKHLHNRGVLIQICFAQSSKYHNLNVYYLTLWMREKKKNKNKDNIISLFVKRGNRKTKKQKRKKEDCKSFFLIYR